MRDVCCKLLSTTFKKNNIGVMIPNTEEVEVPIIKIEDIYADEFYEANEQGFKPTLRLRISNLNDNNQDELIYMKNTYSIIRTQEVEVDELILICERKIKNVKDN